MMSDIAPQTANGGLNEQMQQMVKRQRTCLAAAVGPDGMLDGSLLFGAEGFIGSPAPDRCSFSLNAIQEGSRLRAWLRIGRRTGTPVPWTMFFTPQKREGALLIQGQARLVQDEPSGDQPVGGLRVEVTIARALSPLGDSPGGLLAGGEDTTPHAADRAVRELVNDPEVQLTDPVREFLGESAFALLCTADDSGAPTITYQASRLTTAPPDTTSQGGKVNLPLNGDGGGEAVPLPVSAGGDVVLIVPIARARLAVRVAGPATLLDADRAAQGAHLTGAGRVLEIDVNRVEVQGGDWSLALQPSAPSGNMRVSESVLRLHGMRQAGRAEVAFLEGPTVLVKGGESLLEIAEENGVPLEAGCRMGICGADPVRIEAGVENLSPVRRSEQSTLDRLGLPAGCRMACSARVQGPVIVEALTDPAHIDATSAPGVHSPAPFPIDPAVQRVVVIGTGIAGITTVEEVRKLHPDAEITVLGAERYDFYNRMAISRLVDDETTVEKLALLTADWATRRRVRYLPGTAVTRIDRDRNEVIPAEGEPIPYDRLVLAMGARSNVPPIEGMELEGVSVLRTIDDALRIQQHIRGSGVRRAVVIGGGLLGLEAAYHLTQAGVRVWIVGRGEWPAERQLDEHAGGLLSQMLQDLGIEYLARSEPRRLLGQGRVEGVELADGRILPAGLCLVAAGIVPDVELARSAGLEAGRGVVVDEHMRTSDPAIYAAGDVIELNGRGIGLWPASVDQAQVAAANLLGGDVAYAAATAPAQLKVPGIDVLSVGQIAARGVEDREVRSVDQSARRYRKLIHRDGKVVGAIVIGYPELFDGVADSVPIQRDLSPHLDAIERGDWSSLTLDAESATMDSPVISGVG